MKKTSFIVDISKIDPNKLTLMMDELSTIDNVDRDKYTIEYDETNFETMDKIRAIVDKYIL